MKRIDKIYLKLANLEEQAFKLAIKLEHCGEQVISDEVGDIAVGIRQQREEMSNLSLDLKEVLTKDRD
jgi:hypothetical protein